MRVRRLLVIGLSVLLWGVRPEAAFASTTVALWHMDDTGTQMVDSSGNGLTGSLVNVSTAQPGAVAYAYGFLGKPSYVSVPQTANLNPGSTLFSVTVHLRFAVRPSSTVGDYDVIRKGLSSTPGGNWKMEVLQTGYAFCQFQGSSGRVTITHGPSLADNLWHSVTCRRTGTGVRLTVDGGSWTRSGATGTIANTSATMLGAKNSTGADQYAGLLDEVAITKG